MSSPNYPEFERRTQIARRRWASLPRQFYSKRIESFSNHSYRSNPATKLPDNVKSIAQLKQYPTILLHFAFVPLNSFYSLFKINFLKIVPVFKRSRSLEENTIHDSIISKTAGSHFSEFNWLDDVFQMFGLGDIRIHGA